MKTAEKKRSFEAGESRRRIKAGLADHPLLYDRIHQALLIHLHSRGISNIDEISRRAHRSNRSASEGDSVDHNSPSNTRWTEQEKRRVQEITLETAAKSLTPSEIDDILNLTLKREEARTLEEIANLSAVSFGVLAEKVRAFCALPEGDTRLPESEALAVRVALIRHFISDQLEFIGIAKPHLWIRDFGDLVDHVIGAESGSGRIGGKAAGLFLAQRILDRARDEDPDVPAIPVLTPESYYLRSDVIEKFLDNAALARLQGHKYKNIEEIHNQYRNDPGGIPQCRISTGHCFPATVDAGENRLPPADRPLVESSGRPLRRGVRGQIPQHFPGQPG